MWRAVRVRLTAPVETSKLQPAERRTRKHPTAKRTSVEASIREYGILDPITVNSKGIIVDGHLRFDIAVKIGFRRVPVIRIEHLNEAELRAYALAANRLPAVANYDMDALRLELEDIRGASPMIDLSMTGFSVSETDRIFGNYQASQYDDLEDDPELPDVAGPTIARRGDLYALGDHRLVCGDSLDPAVLDELMDGEQAACCFTDPPYNVKVIWPCFERRQACRVCDGIR